MPAGMEITMKEGKKVRESGIELLRIILMLQIIILHIYTYGGYQKVILKSAEGSFNDIYGRLFWSFCRMPVNAFILISGYFMVTNGLDTMKKSYQRVWKMYKQVYFYSIVTVLVYYLYKPEFFVEPNDTLINMAFFPLLSRTWYFITIYIIISLFAPFINNLLMQLTKKQYQIFLGMYFFFFSVWATLSRFTPFNDFVSVKKVINTQEGKSFASFLLMYFIGGYLRRFVTENKEKYKKYLYLLAFVLLCLLDYFLQTLAVEEVFEYNKVFGTFDNPLVVFEAIFIFLFFREVKFKSRAVNYIASVTLNVYMIHESPSIRDFIWNEWFNVTSKTTYITQGILQHKKLFFLIIIGVAVIVYTACMTIEVVRRFLSDILSKILSKIFKKEKTVNE